MKLGLILLIIYCTSSQEGKYEYKTKNLKDTAVIGTLHTNQKYIKGDTVKL
jgi:hypothetical protein